jgi:hypothetical protein
VVCQDRIDDRQGVVGPLKEANDAIVTVQHNEAAGARAGDPFASHLGTA